MSAGMWKPLGKLNSNRIFFRNSDIFMSCEKLGNNFENVKVVHLVRPSVINDSVKAERLLGAV